MTNTIENKQRFFALYFGQQVHRGNRSKHLDHLSIMSNQKFGHLELKSLSDISDDDLLWLGRTANDYPNSNYKDDLNYCKDLVRRYLSRPPMMNYECVDYLRKRGYLLPFEDLTIEQILAYKWAVIK